MKLSELFLGFRDFYSESQIRKFIINSKNYRGEKENPEDADVLLIFETSNQKTWLVASGIRLYCILDDIRKEKPHINWSAGKNKLVVDNRVIISIKTRDKSKSTGLVDIGDEHKNWLYSKRFFVNFEVKESIEKLLLSSFSSD